MNTSLISDKFELSCLNLIVRNKYVYCRKQSYIIIMNYYLAKHYVRYSIKLHYFFSHILNYFKINL